MFGLFTNAPEYETRKRTPFKPPKADLVQVRAVIPKHLYEKSTAKGLYYASRDVFFAVLFYWAAMHIEPLRTSLVKDYGFSPLQSRAIKWVLWSTYWLWQSIALAGWWCLAHEAGHGTLSPHSWVNHVIGYGLHTFLLVPYYSWRASHHLHHKSAGWVERDQNFVPRTRKDFNLPPIAVAHVSDYHEMLEETPIYTLLRIIAMQLLGLQAYFLANTWGSPRYPKGTNHFSPSSPIFRPDERNKIIVTNVGLAVMSTLLVYYTRQVGTMNFVKLYFIPYLLTNHWIVMLTYLQHSDPTIPHYRTKEWSYMRGAAATVDRPLLGWVGRFFLHNVSHNHVAHHFFSMIPFYNQPQVTEHIKKVLQDDYNYDSTNTFWAFYRTFSECIFIEDEGDIVFYKDKEGKAQRVLASDIQGDSKVHVTSD